MAHTPKSPKQNVTFINFTCLIQSFNTTANHQKDMSPQPITSHHAQDITNDFSNQTPLSADNLLVYKYTAVVA